MSALAMPPMPRRTSSLDPQVSTKVERHLQQRPAKEELVERNILKGKSLLCHRRHNVEMCSTDDSVAPSLQAAREKLQRSQLEVGGSDRIIPDEIVMKCPQT